MLASLEIARSLRARSKGLLGRREAEGALLLERTKAVHSIGMRFAVDVAFLDSEMVVLRTVRLRPFMLALPARRTRHVLEAGEGAFERWSLKKGDKLEVKE